MPLSLLLFAQALIAASCVFAQALIAASCVFAQALIAASCVFAQALIAASCVFTQALIALRMLTAEPCATVLRVPSYLLRVQLEDRPGSLGSVAVALGSVGADILSLDVVERGPGYAIDDLIVDLPPGAMPDMLITAAESLNGVRVHSIRPHTGLLEAHRELELIDHIAAASGKRAKLQVLADEAPRVLRVGWCTVVRLTGSGIERAVGSHGAPETHTNDVPWLPIDNAQALDGSADWVPQVWRDMDTTLAAAPLGDQNTAVVLGRPGGPEFRPSEVARLGYLAGIVATILR